MTYSIWLVPENKDARRLRKIIRDISKKYGAPMFEPHITLYGGIGKIGDAKNAVKTCMASQMSLYCVGIEHSENLWKTLFIKVRNTQKLNAVHQNLRKGLENKYEFRPHISLAYKRLDVRTKKRIASELKIKRVIRFDRITIIKSSKTVSKWERQYTVRLKKT